MSNTLVATLIKSNDISAYVMYWINMERLSQRYGWTPEEILKQDPVHISRYMAILKGTKKPSGSVQENRVFNN